MKYKNILVTGGAGFIGGSFVDLILKNHPNHNIVVLDKVTYAAQPERLNPYMSYSGFYFVQGDICDALLVEKIIDDKQIDLVVNFAAESHVDKSLLDDRPFRKTNVDGVKVLLGACLKSTVKLFVQISTDEVYGQRTSEKLFEERTAYNPRNPYAQSKVDGEKAVLDLAPSSGLDYLITRGCNSFGPWQHVEKLIPKVITNALKGYKIPLYGDGKQEREWIAASDHAWAVYYLISSGYKNQTFNIGTGHTLKNIDVVHEILRKVGGDKTLINFVEDRVNHDFKYGVNTSKLTNTGWKAQKSFDVCLDETLEHYRSLIAKNLE